MSDCENLKFLYTTCIKKIHEQEYSSDRVKECFQIWENLVKCVNTDLVHLKFNKETLNIYKRDELLSK